MEVVSKVKSHLQFIALLIGAVLFFIFLFTDCTHKKAKDEIIEEYGVSEADSLTIVGSANEIMALLKNDDVEEAAEKLRHFNKVDTVVTPLSDDEVQMLHKRQLIFPVKEYEIVEADFVDPLDNTVVYNVAFGNPSPETGEAPMTKMAFNAVLVDGEYWITLKEKH